MYKEEYAYIAADVRNDDRQQVKPSYELTEQEKSGLAMRRSLAAARPIQAGEVFTPENIKSIRPAIGIKPKYYQKLLGKAAKKAYAFGEPIDETEV